MNWKGRKMFSSAVDMQSGGSVPYPGYLTGDLVTPTLFEEGDQDINMALNTMASTTSPSVSDVKESVSMDMGAMGEMPKDQGPESFEDALFMLKQEFYDEITSFVSSTRDIKEIENYLQGMNATYTNELKKVKRAFNIDVVHPEEELLTPRFVQELQNMLTAPEMQEGAFTGMQDGSLVGLINSQDDLDKYGITIPWEFWKSYDEDKKQRWIEAALLSQQGGSSSVGANEAQTQMLGRVNQIIKDRRKLAKKSAEMPLTMQGGFGGFVEQMNAYRANQAAAEDKVLSDEMDYLQYAVRTGQSPTNKNTMSAYQKEYVLKDKPAPITTKDWVDLAEGAARKGDVNPDEEVPFIQVYLALNGKQEVLDEVFPGYLDSVRDVEVDVEGEKVDQAMTFADFLRHKKKIEGDTFDISTNPGFYISEFLALDLSPE
tara:strand:+ start:676 stop:1965 length:1290 start_codon:yes stop_codon:yes gene_type:complete